MIIKNVKLTNFRSHSFFELNCWKETTMISGENGSGKTSILEAIYESLQGKSFRAVDREIVRRGEEFYKVETEFENGVKVVVVYETKTNKKTFLIEDRRMARLTKQYKYPVVLFEPEDLGLVASSPSKKREFFDRILTQTNMSVSSSLSRYTKAMRQRNELLKNEFLKKEDVFSWNVMLARLGTEIWKERERQVEMINERLTDTYRSIAKNNNDEVKIELESDKETMMDESKYLEKLEHNFDKDRLLGYTSFGVHRDNYKFDFNGREADGSASRGEVRSIVIALKFIEAAEIKKVLGKKPVVLLDDVFSELDEIRQKALVKNFKQNQVIITSVNAVEDVV